jgi:DNA-directed RNA polymerase beta' subunit/intein/homing endonuclease
MNLHAPQSVEAATELREIAAVPLQIVSPRESVPIVSVVQDTLVGANRFARSETLFTKKEAMNLLVHAKAWDGTLPPPATVDPQPLWSGQQLLSCLLPPVTLSMKNNSDQVVEIYQGKINPTITENGEEKPNGRLDKKVFSKQLLHIIYNDYGPDVTVNFLDSLQAMIANFLMNNGFSVGISDLIADDETMAEIREAMKKLTNSIETQILQIHTGLFENTSGRSNQEEFEGKVMGTLNKAVGDAGKIGLKSLADTNRMTNMVKAGSKGSDVNVSQMIAVLGQQAIEGKRVPNGFQHRTLPHFKRFDDSARARGFIASSYITGLQPDEFFFHAMSGREGLIDTAVKSVTADTPIVVMENGVTKYTQIGPWIDAYLTAHTEKVERFTERNLEMYHFEHEAFIPTVTMDGVVTWGKLAAVTRHDPGTELYKVRTHGGRSVIVTESKSLIVWNPESKKLEQKPTPEVKVGDCLPVTMNLPTPPHIIKSISVANYLPKATYLYGSEYLKACDAIDAAMEDRERIPAGWWEAKNGSEFIVPYDSKARLTRARSGRSDMAHIQAGYVYPFTTNRENGIPDQFTLTAENGVFLGLYLAEGNCDVASGYVQITNNDPVIRAFAKSWFEKNGLATSENTRTNPIGGTSSDIRGFSTVLAQFMDALVGHGARNKRVPAELFAAPEEFIVGLLNGYFSGDGTVSENSVEVGSASYDLVEGINMLLSRLGMFGRISKSQLTSNNVGTEDIAPTHRLSIRGQWATIFAERIPMIDAAKQARLNAMKASESHRNFSSHKDIVLDTIEEITVLDASAYPKVYDLTIPETFTFGLANGLQVYDTADTGYMQRRIRVALEDLITQHDGSVRDTTGGVLQLSYGEDGINATKLEEQRLPIDGWDDARLAEHYAAEGASGAAAYLEAAKNDRRILVEKVCGGRPNPMVRAPVHMERMIFRVRDQFGLAGTEGTVTAEQVLEAQTAVLRRTHVNNHVWSALVRHYMAPKFMKRNGFTKDALDALVEQIVVKHWRAWVEPGQPVGVLAAQSIGEPATQMTLNTFHLAGVAAKSNMTRGVPRLKELLTATKNPKAVELTIPLRRDIRDKKEEARRVAQQLEFTLLQDLVTTARIYFDPYDETTMVTADQEWMAYQRAFESQEPAEDQLSRSPWLLRIELDRDRMFAKNITMDDIAFILNSAAENGGHSAGLHMLYTDYNATQLVFRMRLNMSDPAAAKKGKSAKPYVDDLEQLKIVQNKILANTAIRGVAGLRSVNYQKNTDLFEFAGDRYKRVEQYVLISDGSNFLEVLTHPDVDPTRIVSSSVHDMLENLGIEATRATLFKEITSLFAESGTNVNYRHVCILVDRMCHKGRLMSVDRYGINKNDIGPLAKMSFEQTEDIALRAAQFGERDPVQGVSAKVMLGAPIRAGTAFTDLLFDEQAAVKLAQSTPEQVVKPVRKQVITADEMNEVTYGDMGDRGECGNIVDAMRSNITLPPNKLTTVAEEPDTEVDLLIVDE